MSDDAMQARDGMTGDEAEAEVPEPVYDQAFFLKLARPREDTDEARTEARERWNKWRRDPANAGRAVTFEGVDFRTEENRGISFEGFEFGAKACFIGAVFGSGARFAGATFARESRFDGARFGDSASFDDAKFGDRTIFRNAIFGDKAAFRRSRFGIWARFGAVVFGDDADFSKAQFGSLPQFGGALFGFAASFTDAVFLDEAWFQGAVFGPETRFKGAVFLGEANFSGSDARRDVALYVSTLELLTKTQRHLKGEAYKEYANEKGFGPGKFSGVSFSGAHFRGAVSFARRSFERTADFTDVRFDEPPDFDGATNLQRIDFTGARAGFVPADRPWWKPDWTEDSSVAVRLRTLRSQIEATKNHDFERDLYIEERKAERGIYFARYSREKRWGAFATHCAWIVVMGGYWLLSDYGRSWLRPAAWLVASVFAFDLRYSALLADRQETAVKAAREGVTKSLAGADALAVVKGWQTAEARVRSDYDAVVGQLAVSNAVPFVGPLTVDADAKKFLFCGVWPAAKGETGAGTVVEPCRPIPPPGFQCAMISQNLLSILLVFFIGLALRNYFRLK